MPESFDESDGRQMKADGRLSTPRPIYRNPWFLWTVLLIVAVVGLYLIMHSRGSGTSAKKPATSGSGGGRGQFSGPVTATVATAYKRRHRRLPGCDRHSDSGLYRIYYRAGQRGDYGGALQAKANTSRRVMR